MKKIGRLKQLLALILAGVLSVGSVGTFVFGADFGDTAIEVSSEEEDVDGGISEEVDDAAIEESGAVATSDDAAVPEDDKDNNIEAYTVTLDANGGYFANEWDDTLNESVERTEILNKVIPIGGTVTAFPVFTGPDGQAMVFAGWSLERDGELVSQAEEEYIPMDNCDLYAVWQAEDAETGEHEDADEENVEQADGAQEPAEVETGEESGDAVAVEKGNADEESEDDAAIEEGYVGEESEDNVAAEEGDVEEESGDAETAEVENVEEDTVSEDNSDPEAGYEQIFIPNQEENNSVQGIEETSEKSPEAAVVEEKTQPELDESSGDEGTIKEDAANGVVASGTWGRTNITWTLNGEGILTIKGTGPLDGDELNSDDFVLYYSKDIKSVIIMEGVTSIGIGAFIFCRSLTSVTIPPSVTEIGFCAFSDCSSLTSVTIPPSVTSIGDGAFQNCSSLTSVTIPSSVTSIGCGAFQNCSSLTSVTIPSSVTSIDTGAFNNCSSLTSVTIPSSVTSIDTGAFKNCSSLTSVTIPSSVTSIQDRTFMFCSSLTSVTIPPSVTSIGDSAFCGCSSLTSVTIPSSVKSIGQDAFEKCDNLTISGYAGSYAESYAIEHNIPFVPITITLYKEGTNDIIPVLISTCGSFSWDSTEDDFSCLDMELTHPADENSLVTSAYITLPDGFSFEKNSIVQNKTITLNNKSEGRLFERTTIYPLYSDADSFEVKYVIDGEEHKEKLPIEKEPLSGIIRMRPTAKVNYHYDQGDSALEYNMFSRYPDFNSKQAFVLNKSNIYHDDLSAIGCMMSQAVYNRNGIETDDDSYIRYSMHNLGFSQVRFDNNSDPDGVAVGFGLKRVISGGNIYNIVMVAVRGTAKLEWIGNFDVVGNNDNVHNNFQYCADDVIIKFNSYFRNNIIKKNIGSNENLRVFLCGHSRGGAVVDLVAHSLNGRFGSNNVYAYTFAAPNSTKNPVDDSNIFNYVYKYDFVPFVPQGYGKHGKTIVVGGDSDSKCPENVSSAFEKFTWYNKYKNVGGEFLIKLIVYEDDSLNKDITFWNRLLGILISNPNTVQDNFIAKAHGAENYCSWVLFNGTKNAVFYDNHIQTLKENTEVAIKVLGKRLNKVIKDSTNTSKKIVVLYEILGIKSLVSKTKKKISLFKIKCPIDTEILDENGVVKGYIQDHNGLEISEDLIAIGDGESTYLAISDDSNYKLSLKGNDDGNMSVFSFLANERGDIEKAIYIEDIPVENSELFSVEVPTSQDSSLCIISDRGYQYKMDNAQWVLSKKTKIDKINPQTYTGKPILPEPVVTFDNTPLVADIDYTVSYSDNINIGTATVTITGIGNYVGEITSSFYIVRASISGASVTGLSNKTYNGKLQTQTPTLKMGSTTLKPGTDYTISYKNGTYAGTATIIFTGKGNYKETKTATFKINKAEQSITAKAKASSIEVGKTTNVSISGAKGTKTFKSSDTSIATVTSAGIVTAKKVGTVKITATSAATDNFNAASKTVTIKIIPVATASITAANQATGVKLTWKKVTGANGYLVYRGSTKIATIKGGSTVTYTDSKANTNGTKYTFKIVPTSSSGNGAAKQLSTYRVTRPAISTLTNSAASKMTVKWSKNAKATGYQIQYCPDKTFKTGNKSVSINSASTVSKVIGSLAKGKTYYVRIRAYKTVGSTKYFSAWSAVKSVKISK